MKRRACARSVTLLLLVSTMLAAPALAAPSRVTTLFDESVGGQKQPSSAAEIEVLRALREAGVVLVDEAQSRKIRSTTDAGAVLASGISGVITSLDADIILAAVCTVSKLESGLLGPNAVRYDAVLEGKLLSVDTGAVVAAFQVQGAGLGFSDRKAAAEAAKKAGEALAREVLPRLQAFAAVSRVELTVEGSPNVSAWDRVVKGLEQIPGVKAVEVLQAGRGLSKVALETDGVDARGLAVAFDEDAALGLDVFGYSATTIKAGWSPERALDLAVFVTAFEQRGGGKGWQGRTAAGIVAAPLANVGFARFPGGLEAVDSGAGPKAWAALATKHGVALERAAVVAGAVRSEGGQVTVLASVLAAGSGEALLARQATCPKAELSACAARVGDELAAGLPAAVVQKRHLFGRKVAEQLGKAGGRRASRPLEVVSLQVAPLFPARLLGAAAEAPVTVKVKNAGSAPAARVVARATLVGFSKAAVDVPVGDLAAGEEREVSLTLALDPTPLASHLETSPAVVKVELDYVVDDLAMTQARTQAVAVHGLGALSWDEPASVAAFVTPRARDVQDLAQGAIAALAPEARRDPLAGAALAFGLLRASGVRYARDTAQPAFRAEVLDDVRFPVQTLADRAGDCDDLSVLFAALVEGSGQAALLLLTPEHVLAAVDTGLAVQATARAALADDDVVAWNGRLYVPVETTALGGGFLEAWKKGAGEARRWSKEPGKLQIVDVREAWAWYAPVDTARLGLPASGWKDSRVIAAAADSTREALTAWRQGLEQRVAAVDEGAEPGKKARLLATLGRLQEARAVFERRISSGQATAADWNNAGNLAALEDDTRRALAAYRKGLEHDPENPYVNANAALAAFLCDDDDAALGYLATCLQAERPDLVEQVSRLAAGSGGVRNADAGGLKTRDLGALARRALEAAGRAVPEPRASGTRASEAGAEAANPIADLLFWL